MDIYRLNVICFSNAEKDRQAYFLTEESATRYKEEVNQELQSEESIVSEEVAEIPPSKIWKVRDFLLFGGNPDILDDLQWEVLNIITDNEGKDDTMLNLKRENFNPWEWNIPTADLVGYVYVADDEDGDLLIMSSVELSDGTNTDVQIIGVSDDMETVTVSTGTNFLWGLHVCTSYESLREAYLHYLTGKVHN